MTVFYNVMLCLQQQHGTMSTICSNIEGVKIVLKRTLTTQQIVNQKMHQRQVLA